MNDRLPVLQAQTLREEFDRAFALPPELPDTQQEQLLAIRAGGQPYALRLDALRGLFAGRRILPLPARLPELLGVTAVRGQMVPVYELGALLGHASVPSPRWLVLAKSSHALGLAFDAFDAHASVAPGRYVAAAPGSARYARQAVHLAGELRPLLDLTALIDDLVRRCAPRE